ncbi:MAG: TlpA family protein disulfide reductase [Bacteroidaceae bacterium]|nr:TlpA family protein disulfide reductase [Bacteroidaceae bacterium]
MTVVAEVDANHNRAHFDGMLEELPVVALLSPNSDGSEPLTEIIIDGKDINVTVSAPASGETQNQVTVQNSPLTQQLLDVKAQVREKGSALNSFVSDVRRRFATSAPSEEEMASLEAQYDQMNKALKDVVKEGITSNRDSKVSLALLVGYFQLIEDFDFVQQTLAGYAFADSPMLQPVNDYIAGVTSKQPGASLIDFELPDAAGVQHKLSEYVGQGSYVLVDFWASWCGPCRAEMPNVVAAYQKYHDKGFDVLSLSFDSNREAWLKAISDLKMTWHHLSDLKGWESLAAQKYDIRAIPSTLLFDPEGKVVAADLRGSELEQKLEELLH